MEKVTKNVLTIIPKSPARPHTMKKTYAKFQNNQYKTVRGVALKRGTHWIYIEVKNDYIHNVEKMTKKNLTIISKSHAHLHTMKKTQAKFQNWSVKNCKRSCAHKTPSVNVDGKTDGRTKGKANGRKFARLSPMLKQVRQKHVSYKICKRKW